MTGGADFNYIKDRVSLPYCIGEKTILRLFFGEGLICKANIFKNRDLTVLSPPKTEMQDKGVDIAFIYSCPLSKRFPKVSFYENYICYISPQFKHYFIRADTGFDQYLKKFSGKTLSTLRRKVKKISSSCKTKSYFQIYSTSDEIKDFYEIAKEISLKTYQHRLLKRGIPASEQFKDKLIRQAAEGKVLGFVLFVEDRPAAYTVGPIYGEGAMLYDHTGYDPGFDNYSPGTVLQFKIIETAFRSEKINVYDLCVGEGKHKELFADDHKLCGNVHFFPLKPKYLLIVYTKIVHEKIMEVLKIALNNFGLKEKVKKHMRRTA